MKKYVEDKNYFMEAIRNGKKGIFTINKGAYTFKDKNGNFIDIPDEIKIDIVNSRPDDMIIEAILVWLDEDDNEVVSRKDKYTEPKLFIVDILELRGEDLRNLSLLERKVELTTVCNDYNWTYNSGASLLKLPYWLNNKDIALEGYKSIPFKGVLFKHINSKYGVEPYRFLFTTEELQ